MRIFIVLTMIVGLGLEVSAQLSTVNNYTGTWSNSNSWTSGNQPNPLTTNINVHQNITINGYITRNGGLSFANIGANSYRLLITDTLIVMGDLRFANNSINLEVVAGGVLVVFGHFTAENKVVLDNGGTMVVTEGMTLSGGQQDYVDNGGGLYVDGGINGNGDTAGAGSVDAPISDLSGGTSGEVALYNFISGGGTTPLPIQLASFDLKLISNGVKLNWETVSEENFSHFEVQRSSDGLDYEVITKVQSQGGASTHAKYSFIDTNLVHSILYYRLNAIDFDGSSELFETQSIRISENNSKDLVIFPNPMEGGDLNLIISDSNELHQVSIFNIRGEMIYQVRTTDSRLEIHDLNFQPGVYFVHMESNGTKLQQKLLVR